MKAKPETVALNRKAMEDAVDHWSMVSTAVEKLASGPVTDMAANLALLQKRCAEMEPLIRKATFGWDSTQEIALRIQNKLTKS